MLGTPMIENELKYVLSLNTDLSKFSQVELDITQGYFEGNARIRSTKLGDETSYKFTFKVSLPNGEVEEFEKTISEAEFKRCFEVTTKRVTKRRHSIVYDMVRWDVDFFYNENNLYFVMAECEMPEGWVKPETLPAFIQENLLFAVPREDSKFYSSKKLSNHEYAAELLMKHETSSVSS